MNIKLCIFLWMTSPPLISRYFFGGVPALRPTQGDLCENTLLPRFRVEIRDVFQPENKWCFRAYPFWRNGGPETPPRQFEGGRPYESRLSRLQARENQCFGVEARFDVDFIFESNKFLSSRNGPQQCICICICVREFWENVKTTCPCPLSLKNAAGKSCECCRTDLEVEPYG